jgi:hypothetical protein
MLIELCEILRMAPPVQAGCQGEVERLSGQLQEAIVAAEVGRAKVLLYDELNSKAEKLVSRPGRHAGRAPGTCIEWTVMGAKFGMRQDPERCVEAGGKAGCLCTCCQSGVILGKGECLPFVCAAGTGSASCMHTQSWLH